MACIDLWAKGQNSLPHWKAKIWLPRLKKKIQTHPLKPAEAWAQFQKGQPTLQNYLCFDTPSLFILVAAIWENVNRSTTLIHRTWVTSFINYSWEIRQFRRCRASYLNNLPLVSTTLHWQDFVCSVSVHLLAGSILQCLPPHSTPSVACRSAEQIPASNRLTWQLLTASCNDRCLYPGEW